MQVRVHSRREAISLTMQNRRHCQTTPNIVELCCRKVGGGWVMRTWYAGAVYLKLTNWTGTQRPQLAMTASLQELREGQLLQHQT